MAARTTNIVTRIFGLIGSLLAAALAAGITGAVMLIPKAAGAEGAFEAFLGILLLAFMVSALGALPVALLLLVGALFVRARAPQLFQRSLVVTAAMGVAGAAAAAGMALMVASALNFSAHGADALELRSYMTLSAAVGGVVLGTLIARSLTPRTTAASTFANGGGR